MYRQYIDFLPTPGGAIRPRRATLPLKELAIHKIASIPRYINCLRPGAYTQHRLALIAYLKLRIGANLTNYLLTYLKKKQFDCIISDDHTVVQLLPRKINLYGR